MNTDNKQTYPISTTSHIIIGLSLSCLFWIFFAKPAMYNIYTSIFTVLFFCIIIPIVMIYYKSYDNSIKGNDFILVKLVSVVIAILVAQGFIWSNNKYKTGDKTLSIVLIVLLMANIIEAVATQLSSQDSSEEPLIDTLNPITGILLCVILIIQAIAILKNYNNLTMGTQDNLILKSNLGLFFILGYTFWNLLFRIQLLENTFVFAFFCVSLLTPIIAQYTKTGDWLQIRAFSLLFVIIIAYGFNDEVSIFPMYNKMGYDQKEDSENILTKIQKNKDLKLCLFALGMIFTLFSLGCLIYKIRFSVNSVF